MPRVHKQNKKLDSDKFRGEKQTVRTAGWVGLGKSQEEVREWAEPASGKRAKRKDPGQMETSHCLNLQNPCTRTEWTLAREASSSHHSCSYPSPLSQHGKRIWWEGIHLDFLFRSRQRWFNYEGENTDTHIKNRQVGALGDLIAFENRPLAGGDKESKGNLKRPQKKRTEALFPHAPALNVCSERSAPRLPGLGIHYSMFLIHDKLHLNFLAHVHLWDNFILSSFFMYRTSKKRPSSTT